MNRIILKLLPRVTVLGLGMGTGCFNYVPIATTMAPLGTDVRVQLTTEGSSQLSRTLGARVSAVDGRLTTISPDSAMVVEPQWVHTADGLRERWTGAQRFTLPRSYVASVERRALDRRKSIIATVAIAGAIATVGVIAMRGGGSEGGRDPGGGTGVFRR